MIANIFKLPYQHQDIVLRIVTKVIGECHSSKITDEVAAKYRLITGSEEREIFVEFCLHTLLYQPPSASGGSPPGLSVSQSNHVTGKTPLNHEMLLVRKVKLMGLLNVVDVMKLPAELVYPLYVAACADRLQLVLDIFRDLAFRNRASVCCRYRPTSGIRAAVIVVIEVNEMEKKKFKYIQGDVAKFDIEKFDGSNDFGLWRVKMRCLLIQHGWEAALDPFPGTMTDTDKTAALKTDIYKKAQSALLLCLDNMVLREVNKEDFPAGVWLKLETLYMTKSLANKLYLKKKMFTFYMHSGKKLSKHIDEFNKLTGDLTNIDIDIDDENQALVLLTSLPPSYDNFM
ncbi:retrovirus-related pol polyprotein from transposon TNT 1-94, partial [Tanacetum coccineum]